MTKLLTEPALEGLQSETQQILNELNDIIFGQEKMTKLLLTGMLARGHVLLEGLPGLGKTELVKGLAHLSGLDFKRIQFTPDLLPGDITGSVVLEEGQHGRQMVFRKGPIFAQVVLADEINRASPKTQSALLEAMQEHSVTVLDTTHKLPEPFFVLATQNPVELDGTYPLPEAQLDRFILKINVKGVTPETLSKILTQRPSGTPPTPDPVCNAEKLLALMEGVMQIALPEAVAHYIGRLVEGSQPEAQKAPELVKRSVRWGASPRAAIALAGCARAHALMAGRPAVGFADVRAVAEPVMGHRLILNYEAGLSGTTPAHLVQAITDEIPELPN